MDRPIKRMLVISDIHGMYDHFEKMLKETHYEPFHDKLILLGDYVDRGQKSKEVVEEVMNLVHTYDAVALKGNHDQMFLDWLKTNDGMNEYNFFGNGGLQTVQSYCGQDFFKDGFDTWKAKKYIHENFKHHIEFLNTLPYFYETDEFIFVHAGLNPFYENWRLTPYEDMLWIRDLFHNNPTQTDKTVVFGHTPCVNLHGSPDIWFAEDKIGIDGACAYGYQLNCLEITDDGYVQYYIPTKEEV
jgi:serine/threonine protein phosphatase 1